MFGIFKLSDELELPCLDRLDEYNRILKIIKRAKFKQYLKEFLKMMHVYKVMRNFYIKFK